MELTAKMERMSTHSGHVPLLSNAPLSTCLLPPAEEGSKPPLELVICARGGSERGTGHAWVQRQVVHGAAKLNSATKLPLEISAHESLSLPRHPGLFLPSPVICMGSDHSLCTHAVFPDRGPPLPAGPLLGPFIDPWEASHLLQHYLSSNKPALF